MSRATGAVAFLPFACVAAACATGAGGSDSGGPAQDAGADAEAEGRDAAGRDSGGDPCASCEVEFSLAGEGRTSAELRGDFRADGWEVGVPMVQSGDRFVATLDLEDGQVVHYKFLVNGGEWIEDPENPDREPDGYGGYNSVRRVSCGCDAPPTSFDWRDAVMYFVLLDRFLDGDPANDSAVAEVEAVANYRGGDLEGVRQKIEDGYFTDLGVNALWLSSPVDNADRAGVGEDGRSYAAYHGYWPTRMDEVEPRVGDLDLLRAVVDAAHAADLKIVLDYVMNHVHQDSPVYADHPDWFWPLDGCVCGYGCSWDAEPERLRCWFRDYLPDFDFRNADARAFSVGNAIQWIRDTGIDGYRLDAVKHIEDSWLTDLRAQTGAEVETDDRHFYMIGETFTGDRDLMRRYVDPATKLDGQFDFPLRAQVARTILMRLDRMADLDAFLGGNADYYGAGAIMGTFLGNHDLPRAIHLAESSPQFGEWDSGKDRGWENQPSLPSSPDPFERVALAYTLLMTMPGVPLIYYGDEIGMSGAGDPDNRRPMQWEGLGADQEWLRDRISRLARIRADHPAARRGTRRPLGASNDVLVHEMSAGGDVLWVALNRSDSPAGADGLPAGEYRDLLGEADVTAPLSIPPRGGLVLATR
ncbi:MAG: hypothetical protein HYY06_25070 [Deltaproteobacteria bacterium]|nr:hypothetical protein [Deltaproteobacteria bacterium]